MHIPRFLTENSSSEHDPDARIRAKRHPDHESQSGNRGPGKPTLSTSTSSTQSSQGSESVREPVLTSPSADTTSPNPTVVVTSIINSVIITTTVTSSDPPPTGAPSAPLPSKPSNQQFVFDDPQNTTTCSTLDLSWVFSGQARVAMTLIVQDQVAFTNSTVTTQPMSTLTFRTLTNSAPSDANGYVWSPVNIKEGWYYAKAFDTGAVLGISAQSGTFFVAQGRDQSCILSNTTTTTNSNTLTTSPTNSIVGTSGRGPLGTRDIIGIALGVTAGVTILVLAYAFPRLWHRELPNPKNRRPYLLY